MTVVMPKTTVLICALNEEENLPHVLPRIPAWVYEVILVDGHSADRTAEIAGELQPGIRVLVQPGKGKQDAKIFGLRHASGDIVVFMDADGQNDPDEMHKFVQPLIDGYDFAKGSRFLDTDPSIPRFRRIGNRIFTTLVNLLYGTNYTDLCSGYNAGWRESLLGLKPTGDNSFMDEPWVNINMKKLGLKVVEVAHRDRGRANGQSTFGSLSMGWVILKIIIRERFRG